MPFTQRHCGLPALLPAVLLLVEARDAHAYLDPATGSMILQGIVGGVMAGLFVLRRQWATVKGWFTRRRDPEGASGPAPGDRDAH
jgi:hypothetical protein